MRLLNRLGRVVLLVVLMASWAKATIDVTLQMQLGNPNSATTADTSVTSQHYLIQRPQYALDYNNSLGEPNWVSWDLTSGDVGGSGRSNDFEPDPIIAGIPNFYALTTTDYNGVGNIDFNRGHMCPSEDRTDTTADNLAVFYMSNIVPQSADNNQGPWELFEDYCRTLASSGNEILITSGPSGFQGASELPSGKAAIPAYTWKIATVVPLGTGSAVTRINNAGAAAIRVIAIKIPNINGIASNPWQNYITTVAQISTDTGLTFFTGLNNPTVTAGLQNKAADGQTDTGLPTISVQPVGQSAPVDGSATFSVAAGDGGNPPLVYQWFKDDVLLSGATGPSLTLSNVQGSDIGDYSVTITNSQGSISSSTAALVVTGLPASIATQPSSVTANAGSNVSFSVTAGGSSPFAYQWQKGGTNLVNGGNVAGATSATLALSNVQAGDVAAYTVVVNNAANVPVTTNPASLTVNPAGVTITTQPFGTTAPPSGSASFTVVATGTAPLTFQWSKGGTPLADGAKISGSASATLTLANLLLSDAGNYSVTVSNSVGSPVTSNPAALTVSATSVAYWNMTLPTPSGLPSDLTGGTITTGNNYGTVAAGVFTTTSASSTSGTIGYPTASAGANAGAASYAVTGTPTAFSSSRSAYFAFTLTPASGKQLSVSGFSFGSRSTSTGPQAYGIYSSVDNFTTAIATGTLTTTVGSNTPWVFYQPTVATVTGGPSAPVTFRIYGYNGVGNASSGTVNWRIDDLSVVVSTAVAVPTVIGTTPAPSATGIAPTLPISVTFNAPVTVSNGWFSIVSAENGTISTSVNTTDQTTYTFTPPANFADNDTITVTLFAGQIADQATGTLHPAANTTFSFTTAAAVPPTIVQQPVAQTVAAGATVNFSVSTAGTSPFAYQWRLNGTPLTDGPGISGSGAASLTLTDVQAASGGNYDVMVNNGVAPSATSTAAALTVNPTAPAIVTTPVAVNTPSGMTATFTVAATGTQPFTYQWQLNGANVADGNGLSGSHSATLTIAGVGPANAGNYSVVVTNGVGSPITTPPVALTVILAQVSYNGGTYNQNFDTLPNSGTYTLTGPGPILLNDPSGVNATGLAGWSISKYSGTGSVELFKVDDGTSTSGSAYSYGTASATDRALGSLASGATISNFGVTFVNTTGQTITQFSVHYTGEQWRYGGSSAVTNTLTFDYQLGGSDLDTGTFTLVPALNFVTPITSGVTAGAALDGNASADRVPISSTVTGISWAPGQTLILRWSDANDAGSDDGLAIDDFSFIAVNPPQVTTPPANLTVTSGQQATFSVTVSSSETPTYQWRFNGVAITNYASASTAQLVIPIALVANAGSYDCVVTNSGGTITSPAAILTVNKAIASISMMNLTQTYTGSPLAVSTSTTPAGLTVTVDYSGNLTPPTAAGSYLVVATVVDTDYIGSDSEILVIQAAPTPPIVAPAISLAPMSYSGAAGNGVTLSVGASGGGTLTYQWYKNGTAIAGANNATLSLAGSPADSGQYTVAVTNSTGSVTSSAAAVTFTSVIPTAPTISTQPSAATALIGSSVSLTVAAVGNPVPTYQWMKNGVAIAGATNATLTIASVQASDAAAYTVIVANSAGSVASSLATLTVTSTASAPIITRQPLSTTLAAGGSLTLTVVAEGAPAPTYQWNKNGAVISGATGATLTIASVQASDAAGYTVTVTNSAGAVTSNPAFVAVPAKSYAGFYFGSLSNGGSFAIQIFADNTGIFLGFAAGSGTAYVSRAVSVDGSGHFSFTTQITTGGSAPSGAVSGIHAAAINADVTTTDASFSGTIGADGSLTGSGNGVTLTASKSASGSTTSAAGYYEANAAGSSATTLVIVSPSGQAFVLTQNGSTVDGGTGTVDASGNATLTTPSGAKVVLSVNTATSQLTDTTTSSTGATTIYSGSAGTAVGAAAQRVVNLSSRALITANVGVTSGFVISGVASKPVLLRGVGPSLSAFGIANPLTAPKLNLFNGAGAVIATNTGWQTGSNASLVSAIISGSAIVGAFPLASPADSALLVTLAPGKYTAGVTSSDGTSGIALVEVYDLSGASLNQQLINISTLANAGVGVNALVAGVVVAGLAPQRVLIRAAGPGLSQFGVTGVLAHPLLVLYSGPTVVASNTGWGTSPDASALPDAFTSTGAFPFATGSADSALIVNLAPGAYSAQVTGADGGTGAALVEVYQMP